MKERHRGESKDGWETRLCRNCARAHKDHYKQ